jgi:hypothetical protein
MRDPIDRALEIGILILVVYIILTVLAKGN